MCIFKKLLFHIELKLTTRRIEDDVSKLIGEIVLLLAH